MGMETATAIRPRPATLAPVELTDLVIDAGFMPADDANSNPAYGFTFPYWVTVDPNMWAVSKVASDPTRMVTVIVHTDEVSIALVTLSGVTYSHLTFPLANPDESTMLSASYAAAFAAVAAAWTA